VPETATAEVAAAEMPSTEMAVGKMSAAEVPSAEVPAAEMAEAAEVAASEAAEMTEASEVAASKTSEMTTSEAAEVTAAAEVPAAAEPTVPTVPKGKGFAHHARHHARRERGFDTEPERDRRCENFCHPPSHDGLLPPAAETVIPSLLRTQPTHGRFRAFHGI
jgi:hypothetical protein